MRRFGLFVCIIGGLAVSTAVLWSITPLSFSFRDVRAFLGSIFFVESTTTSALQDAYRHGRRIRILIVPGHDSESYGTEHNGLREAALTVALGEDIASLLEADPRFKPILVRTKTGYAPEFLEYFANNDANVKTFVAEKKKVMKDLLHSGLLEKEEGVIHNSVPNTVAYRLYLLNMWANENAVDIVIHIHFNNYPRKTTTKPGRYTGYTIYVPDKQYSNARPSHDLATNIARRLSEVSAPSTHPQEGDVVPDQELIALGSYNTLDPAGVLVEYGYIYEPQFAKAKRGETLHTLATLTYAGLLDFFNE
jgi:N-acetylmuramoyl-L-alanine amidase